MRTLQSFIVSALIIGLGSWLGYSFWESHQPKPVILQGQIEAQQYGVSSKIAGRLDKVLVQKGDLLKKGDLVFTINSPEIEAKLAQAKAGKSAAMALLDKAESGARIQQIQAAKDQWLQAKVQVNILEKTYKRINTLFKEGVSPEQSRDEVFAKLQAARHAQNAALQMYTMAQEGARNEDKLAALGQERRASGVVQEVEVYKADTRISAPHDGEVTQILLRSGELAPQGFPVVSILDLEDAWALFHVREDQLHLFQKGNEFTAKIPALNGEFLFKVTYLSVLGDFATWRTTNSETGFDMRTFEVEARPVKQVAGLRAGMSVLIEL